MSRKHDEDASKLDARLGSGPRLGVLGSAELWGEDTARICTSLGRQLASLPGLVLLTGGVAGVGETVGRALWRECRSRGSLPAVYHVLPDGSGDCDYGTTLHAGNTMIDRREVLARLAGIYLVIEGGPGTVFEAKVAREQGAALVPIARTGGFAAQLHSQTGCPVEGCEDAWEQLRDLQLDPDEVASAAVRIVKSALGDP